MKPAFTLIELMVVMAIGALIATLTIPSYIRFNRSQEVKQAALFLKSNLRDAQNRSFSGEKDTTCLTTDILSGFFGEVSVNGISFNIRGICGTTRFPSSSTEYTKLFSGGVTINRLLGNCSTSYSGTRSMLFKPLGKGVIFYSGSLSSGTPTELNITKLGVELKNSTGDLYYVIITSGGEIYEKTSCS